MSIILNYINYFWKLGYNEEVPDIYVKKYSNNLSISIDMKNEIMVYGDKIRVTKDKLAMFSQRNFVILECIDRLIEKGYSPNSLELGRSDSYDIAVKDESDNVLLALKCKIWENDYDNEIRSVKNNAEQLKMFFKQNSEVKYLCIYTSRLKAGLIDYKNTIFAIPSKDQNESREIEMYFSGIFEDGIKPHLPKFVMPQYYDKEIQEVKTNIGDFEIENDVLVKYNGNDKNVIIPEGVAKLSNAVFWNCTEMTRVAIPNSVRSLGGDTFYNCTNLVDLTIPNSIEVIGDNPFANCPSLNLINNSPKFELENDALYNQEKTRMIYFAINSDQSSFTIPDGVISIGKHAFYNCTSIEKIIIPSSVTIMENNPFSNCPNLTLENHSPHFILENGALYNKPKTTLSYFAINNSLKSYVIPDGVTIIGRHSFYNCQYLESLTIPSSVKIIGYNPFTNCSSLFLINHSPNYIYENGALYDKTKTELIYYSIPNPADTFTIPDTVKLIGRNAFFGCGNLKKVIIPDSVTNIDRSAFAKCSNLTDINIPESVQSLGEWAFFDCSNLTKIDLPEHTSIESLTFLNSPVKITRKNNS